MNIRETANKILQDIQSRKVKAETESIYYKGAIEGIQLLVETVEKDEQDSKVRDIKVSENSRKTKKKPE